MINSDQSNSYSFLDIQDNFETLKAYFDWQVVVDREDYNSLRLNYNSIYNEITRLQNTSRIEILALSNNENLIDEELESNNQLLNSKYDAFIQDLKSLDTSIKITHDDFKIALINDLDLLLSTTNNLTAEQIVSPFQVRQMKIIYLIILITLKILMMI